MSARTFIFFGNVGSGKGTQVKLLMDHLKSKDAKEVVYIYPGSEYRKLVESKSYTGSLVEGPMKRGELLPGFLTDGIVTNILVNSLTSEKHVIADGYPRALDQSINFERMMQFYKRDNIEIIYIDITEDKAMKRNLARGREDDTEEGILQRFQEYKNNVVPAMNYFKDNPGYKIHTIDGEQPMEHVHNEIISALGL